MKHGKNNNSKIQKKLNKTEKSSMIKINVVKLDIKKHNESIVHQQAIKHIELTST